MLQPTRMEVPTVRYGEASLWGLFGKLTPAPVPVYDCPEPVYRLTTYYT